MKKLISFIFLFLAVTISAQDLIVKKDGTKIYCRITTEDSISIYYFKGHKQNITQIEKREVENYFLAKPLKTEKNTRLDSTKPSNELIILKVVGGFANPVGDFGSKDLESETSGLANTGYHLNVSAIIKLTRNFGLCGDYRYQKNGIDKTLLEDAFFTGAPANLVRSLEAGSWISKGFFGGFYFTAPVKSIQKFSLDFTILGGLPKFESPELAFTFSQGYNHGWVTQYSGKASAVAFLGKMGFNYKIEPFALNFAVSYFSAKPSFTSVLIKDSFGRVDYTKFDQKISTFCVEAGLSFLIFR